nr:hypothetical protein [Homoserinibacter gongjuensis]
MPLELLAQSGLAASADLETHHLAGNMVHRATLHRDAGGLEGDEIAEGHPFLGR